MVDVEGAHRVRAVAYLVADAVLPAARPPVTVERCAQGRPDSARLSDKRSGDELPCGEGSGGGKEVGQGSSRAGSQEESVGRLSHRLPERSAAA